MTDNGRGVLVLVATPIGNLEDLSPRAARVLREADVVLAEDTRRSAKLVSGRDRIYSYHDHNVKGRIPQIRSFLAEGKTIALVTDAGTPGISDPAYAAVRAALDCGAGVEVVPGPCAVVTALVLSGLPTDRFCFEGFLPRRRGKRLARLREMSPYRGTLVYFVGPHHLQSILLEMKDAFGDRQACIARELTKLHEEVVRGSLERLAQRFADQPPKGEITLVVSGADAD
jgi:16S rRNA (cytidine1402-2'-O)-methyltransferase